jgi:thioredoxin reductase (NADPH)
MEYDGLLLRLLPGGAGLGGYISRPAAWCLPAGGFLWLFAGSLPRRQLMNSTQKSADASALAYEHLRAQMQEIFGKITHDIPLILFTSPGKNEIYCNGARQVIRALREATPHVSLREFDLSHEQAKRYKVDFSPTLLIDPASFHIRWQGAPLGEEARTFVEAIIMLGYRQTKLADTARQVLAKLDAPRNIKVFVSPSCPYCPQQAVNALKAAIERPDLVSLEIIDVQANPVLADKYEAFSVPQVYANEVLISLGAQTEELFMASLLKLEEQTVFIPESDAQEVEVDLLIAGGGPAGLTAGIYAARSGLKSVVVEKGALGGQVSITPVVENYPGFAQIGGKTLVDIMVSHALEYVNIFPGEEVMKIEPGEPIVVTTTRRRFKARAVLLATGAQNRKLNVQGENNLTGRGVSYCATCDGQLFKGKKVIVVGGGDSALTDALYLQQIGVDVTVVHRRQTFRAQEYLVRALDGAEIPVLFDHEVKQIKGRERVREVIILNRKTGKTNSLEVDGVFIAAGYEPAVGLARTTGIELTEDGYIRRDERHRTSVPGIYSAGDVEGGYKQIVTAAGTGSEAAIAIFEDLINPYWKK